MYPLGLHASLKFSDFRLHMVSFPREALLKAGLADSMSPCSFATDSALLRVCVLGVYCSFKGIILVVLSSLGRFLLSASSLLSLHFLLLLVVSCISHLSMMRLVYPLMLNAAYFWFMHKRCTDQLDELMSDRLW